MLSQDIQVLCRSIFHIKTVVHYGTVFTVIIGSFCQLTNPTSACCIILYTIAVAQHRPCRIKEEGLLKSGLFALNKGTKVWGVDIMKVDRTCVDQRDKFEILVLSFQYETEMMYIFGQKPWSLI